MSEIKYCDNCNFLVHDSAKGDLCLACEKDQSPPAPDRLSHNWEQIAKDFQRQLIERNEQVVRLQRDLEECLPLLENYQGILSDSIQEAKDLNDSGPNENLVNEFNAVKALIQKLGAK